MAVTAGATAYGFSGFKGEGLHPSRMCPCWGTFGPQSVVLPSSLLPQTQDGVSPLFTSRRAAVGSLLEALRARGVALLLLWW